MKKTFAIIVAAALAAGCASTKNASSPQPQPDQADFRPVNIPDKLMPLPRDGVAQPLRDYAAQPSEPAAPQIVPVYAELSGLVFPYSETQHVRTANTAPARGETLVLPLPEMQRDFCYPLHGKMISPYGMRGRSMHTGMDIKARPGDTIRAAWAGVVRMSKPYSGYGNIIVIRHANGIETAYSHNSRNLVQPNDCVAAGQPIALAGRTGRATTEHLHFEVRTAGEHINPALLLDYNNFRLNRDTLVIVNDGGKPTVLSGFKAREKLTGRPATYIAAKQPEQAPAAGEVAPAAEAQRPEPPAGMTEHCVQKGETLYKIASAYGVSIDQLCQWNSISRTSTLSIGQRLAVAPGNKPVQTAQAAKPAQTQPSAAQYHTIAKGETLSAIARTYHTSVAEICRINNLENPDRLALGQKLRIP